MSFLTNYPFYILAFLGAHIEFLLGYAFCVLFPVPFLNSWIIDMWAKLLRRSTDTPTND